MSFFKQVEGEACVLVENGVYRQCDVYTRDGYLYGKLGSGFVRLHADGATTKAKCRLVHLSWTGGLYRDVLGRLCTGDAAVAKTSADASSLLLEGRS